MDAMIYHLIGLTIVSTTLFTVGWLDVLKAAFLTAFVRSPFVFAMVCLAQTDVITI